MKAADVTAGAWTATWMRWAIDLIGDDTQWAAVVRTNPGEATWILSNLVAAQEGFRDKGAAVKWVCDTLRKAGAVVMVLDAPKLGLEDLLEFTPMGVAAA